MAGAVTAYLLNLADILFTIHAVSNRAVEANPLMQSIPVMVVYKTIVVGALLWWLSRHSKTGIRLVALAYAAVDVWHIINIF